MRLVSRHGAATAFATATRAAARTPWREASWCAIDLELTGLNPRHDEIIAIGAVPIEQGRVLLGQAAYTLVRTTRRSERDAVLLHKLRVPDLADAPSVEQATELVLEMLSGRVPVFHTAVVERSFLGPLLRSHRVRLPPAADTEALGRLLLRHREGLAPARLPLGRLASMLGLPPEPEHHALGDALTTAAAFIALAGRLDAIERQTVGSLVTAQNRLQGARRMGPG
jgi:DNA polymerase III subunit epsilon